MKRISLAVCLALMPIAAGAAGLGKMMVYSGLGEPLNAEIEISAEKSELSALSARIAPPETYAEQGLERPAAVAGIRVALASKADGTPVIRLTTPHPVDEPFLNMLLQLDWPTGRLLREYTTLLDPPGFGEREQAALPAAVSVQPAAIQAPAPVKKKTSTAAPLSPAPAVAPDATAPESTYRTRQGDTLRSIARRMQVDDVSLEQMLVGLYRANRGAFVDDNMNRLMVGKIIRAPQQDDLRAVSQEEAVQEIRLHAENWNAYRTGLAGAVARARPDADAAPRQSETGRIAASAEDKAASAPGGPRDVVKLSQGDIPAVQEGKGVGGDARVRSLEEEAIAQDRAIKEVTERIAFFEQQIKDMQQLLLVQNQILAELQKGGKPAAPAGEAPSAQPAAPPTPPPPVAVTAPPAEAGLLDRLPVNPLLLGGAAALLALLGGIWLYLRGKRRRELDSFEKGILTAGGLKPQAAAAAAGAGAAAGAPERDTTFLSGFATHGGEGLIDASDVDPISEAEVYMAYGRDAQAEEILKDAIAKEPARHELHLKLLEVYAHRKDAAAFDRLAGELYATLGSASPLWQKVAELGRTLEPGNPMYAAAAGAVVAAAAAAAVTAPAAQPAAAAEVEEAGAEEAAAGDHVLDFDLGLLEAQTAAQAPDAGTEEESRPAGAEAAPASFALEASVAPEAAGTQAADRASELTQELPEPPASGIVQLEAEELGLSQEEEQWPAEALDFTLPPSVPAEVEEAAAEAGKDDQAQAVGEANAEVVEEISLELPELPELTQAPEPAAEMEPLAVAAETDVSGVTADVSEAFGIPAMPEMPGIPEASVPPEAMPEAPAAVEARQESPALDEVEPTVETAAAAEAVEEIIIEQPAAEAAGLDFNFDVDVGDEAEPATAATAESQPLPDLDLSAISLDLDAPAVAGEEITLSSAESPDVDTKLDLVTAYMDMGDGEGARELLEEVLREGGPNQRERARKMLESL